MLMIIDNYDSFTFNLYQAAALFHDEIRVIRNNKITIDEINKLSPDGIILSPGPGRPEAAGICVDLIRAIIEGKMKTIPLLGVCLGHQALVVAAGGSVIQSSEICHGKDDVIYHQQTHLYQDLPQPLKAGRYHSLIADHASLPPSLIIEAYNQQKMIMGVRHVNLPLYGVQFHPESILTPDGGLLIKAFVETCIQNKKNVGAAA